MAILICALLVLAAGCATDRSRIVFSDEPAPARGGIFQSTPAPPPPKKLEKADQLKVELAVYGYLVQRHFWDGGDYGAIFIRGDRAELKQLQKLFPNHVPPLKTADRAELRPGRSPLDRDNGKPAIILSVDAGEPNADDSVDALGKWFAGDAVTGFYTFGLRKTGADWQIESVK